MHANETTKRLQQQSLYKILCSLFIFISLFRVDLLAFSNYNPIFLIKIYRNTSLSLSELVKSLARNGHRVNSSFFSTWTKLMPGQNENFRFHTVRFASVCHCGCNWIQFRLKYGIPYHLHVISFCCMFKIFSFSFLLFLSFSLSL